MPGWRTRPSTNASGASAAPKMARPRESAARSAPPSTAPVETPRANTNRVVVPWSRAPMLHAAASPAPHAMRPGQNLSGPETATATIDAASAKGGSSHSRRHSSPAIATTTVMRRAPLPT